MRIVNLEGTLLGLILAFMCVIINALINTNVQTILRRCVVWIWKNCTMK